MLPPFTFSRLHATVKLHVHSRGMFSCQACWASAPLNWILFTCVHITDKALKCEDSMILYEMYERYWLFMPRHFFVKLHPEALSSDILRSHGNPQRTRSSCGLWRHAPQLTKDGRKAQTSWLSAPARNFDAHIKLPKNIKTANDVRTAGGLRKVVSKKFTANEQHFDIFK